MRIWVGIFKVYADFLLVEESLDLRDRALLANRVAKGTTQYIDLVVFDAYIDAARREMAVDIRA